MTGQDQLASLRPGRLQLLKQLASTEDATMKSQSVFSIEHSKRSYPGEYDRVWGFDGITLVKDSETLCSDLLTCPEKNQEAEMSCP